MPLYEYRCDSCGQRFERIQKFSDLAIEACPACGRSPVIKLISAPGIHFKGSGWYITDYAKGSSSAAGSDKPEQKTGTEGKAEASAEAKAGAKADTRTESKTESKAETKAETKPPSTPGSETSGNR